VLPRLGKPRGHHVRRGEARRGGYRRGDPGTAPAQRGRARCADPVPDLVPGLAHRRGTGRPAAYPRRRRDMRRSRDVGALVDAARAGEPRAVARLVSLVEDGDRALPEIAAALARYTGAAQVLGLTGPPGVGKSTTTSELIRALRADGKRVGVLAVDPSS